MLVKADDARVEAIEKKIEAIGVEMQISSGLTSEEECKLVRGLLMAYTYEMEEQGKVAVWIRG